MYNVYSFPLLILTLLVDSHFNTFSHLGADCLSSIYKFVSKSESIMVNASSSDKSASIIEQNCNALEDKNSILYLFKGVHTSPTRFASQPPSIQIGLWSRFPPPFRHHHHHRRCTSAFYSKGTPGSI